MINIRSHLIESVKKSDNISDLNYSRYRINGEIEVFQGAFTSRSFKPHFHNTYALILVESGVADYGIKNKRNVVTDNKLLVLNPYEVHTGRSLGDGVWNFRSMYLPNELVRSNYNIDIEDGQAIFMNQLINETSLLARYQMLHSRMLESELDMDAEVELQEILHQLAELSGVEVAKVHSDKYRIVSERMRDYIYEYYRESIQLDDLMKITGLSRFHLIKVFKERFGLAPNQYLNNLRIEKAKELLIQGLKATEVAFSVGYFDQSHFIRHFKKVVGVTPSAYLE